MTSTFKCGVAAAALAALLPLDAVAQDQSDLISPIEDKLTWPAAGSVDTGLGLHSLVLERHGA